MKQNTGMRVLVITIAVFLAIGMTLLLVARRFWFERPEPLPSQPAVQGTLAPPSPLNTADPGVSSEPMLPPSPTPEPTPDPTPVPTPVVTGGTELERLEEDGFYLSMRKFETGEGQDMITYFVAEVIVSDMNRIGSGFAKDTFGRNYQEKPSLIAARLGAVFAVNGDYYGYRDDGVIIRDGVLYRDVPERNGAAFLRDGRLIVYDEMETSAADLLAQGALHSFSFGPILVENGQVRESLKGSVNPRTAMGMIEPGHFVFAVVDGRLKGYSKGMSPMELAELMSSLGCVTAYNLDGGGSSTMVWDGQLINKPQGKDRERASSDILFVK